MENSPVIENVPVIENELDTEDNKDTALETKNDINIFIFRIYFSQFKGTSF